MEMKRKKTDNVYIICEYVLQYILTYLPTYCTYLLHRAESFLGS